MHDLTHDLPTPALSTLLGKGELTRANADTHTWLRHAFGLSEDPALAPLRLLGSGGSPVARRCLCVDPVSFSFMDRNVIVGRPEDLQLTTEEATALVETLAPVYREVGEFAIATPSQWHLLVHEAWPALPMFSALPDFVGRRADQGLPADPRWRFLLNEAQLILHAHPVNEAREKRGAPRVSSIWPWGGGSLIAGVKTSHDIVYSASAVLSGMASLCQVPIEAVSDAWGAMPYHNPLIDLSQLASFRSRGDGLHWREALIALEKRWFVPALRAMRQGELHKLAMVFPDSGGGSQLNVSREAMLKFWRRPVQLTALT